MPLVPLENGGYTNGTNSDPPSPDFKAAPTVDDSSSSFLAPNSRQWTDSLPKTQHVQLFLSTDWESTSLGPLEDWGPALRFATTMLFSDSRPGCIYWGSQRTAIYNEQFKVLAVNAHPMMMGTALCVAMPEVYNDVVQIFTHVEATMETVDVHHLPLFTKRDGFGFLEEVYFIAQFIPLRSDDGKFGGVYNTCCESTEQVCLERFRKLQAKMAALPPTCVSDAFEQIITTLRGNPHDISMALLYSIDHEMQPASIATLRGSIGLPERHICTATTLDLATATGGLARLLREVRDTRKQLSLKYEHPRLVYDGEHLFKDVDWAGFGEPARDIVISPLCDNAGGILGILIHGTNPRRPYDDNVRVCVAEMAHQIEAKWLSSISRDEAQLREEALELRLTASERKLRQLAHAAPLGMMQLDLAGNVQWANDQMFHITGLSKNNPNPSFAELNAIYLPEDVELSHSAFKVALAEDQVVREFRLARMWQPPVADAEPVHAWVLGTGYSAKVDGEVKHILGFMLDISHQKWAESVQSRNASAATLAKTQQEKFIDELSHEIRNPLMAMTQLADGVLKSLDSLEESELTREQYRSIVHDNVEAAGTIVACAMHQKRMIDDVLILSRLESEMLSITPVAERPSAVVDGAVRMFSREEATTGISMSTVKHASFESLQVDYVLCDTSRLMQILINLLSNAVKFTATQSTRKLDILYGVQLEPPEIHTPFGDIIWLESQRLTRMRSHLPSESEPLYVYFVVRDTGPGLTSEEIDRLFKRFSQASSKTHITYGGTGLGLYICRELAEKQGGQVGVASLPGQGAAFAFYIATCRTEPEARKPSLEELVASTKISVADRGVTSHHATVGASSTNPSETDQQSRAGTTRSKSARSVPSAHGGFHLLLVEDNLINQKVLAKQLTKAHCTVTVANHGAEALKLLEQTDCWRMSTPTHNNNYHTASAAKPIHVVLLDWEMPVMDGLECARRIRELERTGEITRHLVIIAITANTRDEQINQALESGMDDVMPKPFTVTELLEKIAKVVGAAV